MQEGGFLSFLAMPHTKKPGIMGPGIESVPLSVNARNPNPWTAREFLGGFFFFFFLNWNLPSLAGDLYPSLPRTCFGLGWKERAVVQTVLLYEKR